jgi:hypothetical protein
MARIGEHRHWVFECRRARGQDRGDENATNVGNAHSHSQIRTDDKLPPTEASVGENIAFCRTRTRSRNQDRTAGLMLSLSAGQIRTGGVSPPLSSLLSPAPSGAFFEDQSSPIHSTATRPVGRMGMLETTTLLGCEPSPPRDAFSGRAFLCPARGSRRAARLVRGDNRDVRSILRSGTNNALRDIEELLSSGDFPKLGRCGSGKPTRTQKNEGESRMAAP